MGDKSESKNEFKFSLYQEDVLLCEKVFDADLFNPFTRYSIDIRNLLPQAITRFQRVLSRKQYDTELYGYDLFAHYKNGLSRGHKRYSPVIKEYQIDTKTIRGVECKLGLYICKDDVENPIVERMFYVDGFNPVARFSTDVMDEVLYVVQQIFDRILKDDVENMWDDYDLINLGGFTIQQIRELSTYKRTDLLRRIRF